ncbi:serine/threonine protein phosphatase PrpC [Sinorhizobium kostiense]|uniref:Serine/threonine protein phosphatase PrpC n=1 Tax=Sinorhizobium kostiense TaxID=76747 RepID=A0ABS4QUJ3_9HYPH|nr:bifunctional protein-serine/threonine kinase/phosphatase [Sinorhizobium kostiense]MBP2234321.1 serine/threonine protein phosphatase PrpC [Sinorhizobium kostiense]
MLKSLDRGRLTATIGQHSAAGRKTINQDFYGAIVPNDAALMMKGIALAIADGISSSPVSHIAAETAVKSFLTDYYCTSDAWTVKTAASRVIEATNSWLNAQNRGIEDRDHAHVTTFSALVLKGRRAHLFHVGDSRIWRLSGRSLEPLTTDHRLAPSQSESYLGRALGLLPSIEIDYRRLDVQPGDLFVLTTDGIHNSISPRKIAASIASGTDLSAIAADIATSAYEAGSSDNLTIQIVRIESLPEDDLEPVFDKADSLPPAPLPRVSCEFEGYQIHRQIHASHRSHIFLATGLETGETVALKFTSADMREDENYLRRFAMEEWIARRISSAHVLKSRQPLKPRRSLYLVTEFVDGETLAQWMADRPQADLRAVRDIIGQIADGLRALHRKEIIHQDLRPENLMIDRSGTVKIIDFGSALVAGLNEAAPGVDRGDILGTVQYAAPEYFVGATGNEQSDLFSVGVIAYQMLTGRLPYGAAVARTRNRKQQQKLRFGTLREIRPDVPDWVEGAIRKAVHPDPAKRYQALSEFVYDLSHPNPKLVGTHPQSLMDRDPLLFWKCLTILLSLAILGLLLKDFG